jgi:hypothetical protein
MTAPVPLVYPLAGLLAEPAGTERRYEVHGATLKLPDDLHLAEPIKRHICENALPLCIHGGR